MKKANKAEAGPPKKILVNVWGWLVDELNRKARAACLRRDEFLDVVLKHEAEKLTSEVKVRNSPASKAYISEHLGRIRRRQVNLNLSADTALAIAMACEQVNVPRDAFINRVFLFLIAKRPSFKKLLSGVDWSGATDRVLANSLNYISPNLDGAISAMEEIVRTDPFWFYRECIKLTNESIRKRETDGEEGLVEIEELHHVYIPNDFLAGEGAPESLVGFNCYLPDWRIQEDQADRRPSPTLEDLLGGILINLEGFDRENR